MSDLKPCPFCGRKVEIRAWRHWDNDDAYVIECHHCCIDMGEFETIEEAANTWNNRVDSQKQDHSFEEVIPDWWIFTFGCGQEHAGQCVMIWGTYGSARQKMVNKYGQKWAFQYSLVEWTKRMKDPHRCYPMEKIMEVIQ